jgi:hypothetical protein
LVRVRVYDAVDLHGSLVVAGVDDNGRLHLEQLGLDGSVRSGPVDLLPTYRVGRLSLAVSVDAALVLAVADETGRDSRVLTGQPVRDGLPVQWSSKKFPNTVYPANQLITGYHGTSAVLGTDAFLLAAVPEAAILDPRSGRVALSTAVFQPDRSCGVSGAVAWTGTTLFSWGGQTCRPDQALSAAGVLWTVSRG